MTWACMAAGGTDVHGSKMKAKVQRRTVIQPNTSKLFGCHLIIQQDNDPKHVAKVSKELLRMRWIILDSLSHPPDLSLNDLPSIC